MFKSIVSVLVLTLVVFASPAAAQHNGLVDWVDGLSDGTIVLVDFDGLDVWLRSDEDGVYLIAVLVDDGGDVDLDALAGWLPGVDDDGVAYSTAFVTQTGVPTTSPETLVPQQGNPAPPQS